MTSAHPDMVHKNPCTPGQAPGGVDAQDGGAVCGGGQPKVDLPVKAPWAAQRRVNRLRPAAKNTTDIRAEPKQVQVNARRGTTKETGAALLKQGSACRFTDPV